LIPILQPQYAFYRPLMQDIGDGMGDGMGMGFGVEQKGSKINFVKKVSESEINCSNFDQIHNVEQFLIFDPVLTLSHIISAYKLQRKHLLEPQLYHNYLNTWTTITTTMSTQQNEMIQIIEKEIFFIKNPQKLSQLIEEKKITAKNDTKKNSPQDVLTVTLLTPTPSQIP